MYLFQDVQSLWESAWILTCDTLRFDDTHMHQSDPNVSKSITVFPCDCTMKDYIQRMPHQTVANDQNAKKTEKWAETMKVERRVD